MLFLLCAMLSSKTSVALYMCKHTQQMHTHVYYQIFCRNPHLLKSQLSLMICSC